MLGKKIKKPLTDYDEYSQLAQWCNENNATIEDKGEYYECVEIPEPTTEEKRQAIISQYESDKTELQKQLIEAILYNDTALQEEIKADMADVDAQFDADIKELEG